MCGLLCFEQVDHRLTHGCAYVHVGLGVSVVMAVGRSTLTQWVRIDRSSISLECGISSGSAIDSQLSFEDQFLVALSSSFVSATERGTNEFGVRCLEFTTKRLNQVHQILFVPL